MQCQSSLEVVGLQSSQAQALLEELFIHVELESTCKVLPCYK